jgi:hypothetical protein
MDRTKQGRANLSRRQLRPPTRPCGPTTPRNGLRSRSGNRAIARCNRNSRRSARAKTTSRRQHSDSARPRARHIARPRQAAPFHITRWSRTDDREGPNTIGRSACCAPVAALNSRLARGANAAKNLPASTCESVEFAGSEGVTGRNQTRAHTVRIHRFSW